MRKLLIILLGLLIATIWLGIVFYVYKHSNKQKDTILHKERVGVVGGEEKSISRDKREEAPQRFGQASWYDRSVCGKRIYGETCKTANGEVFDENAFTMACSYDFALGDRVELCYGDICAIARCTDRGNFERLGRSFDLTLGLFRFFGEPSVGVIEVEWKIIE